MHIMLFVFQLFANIFQLSDQSIREPEVSVYATTKSQQGRNTFLCHARNMFPDMVRFHWKVLKDDNWVNMEKSEGEVLELNFSDKTRTSMMLIDEQKIFANHYACSYTHETGKDGTESKLLEIKKGTILVYSTDKLVLILLLSFLKSSLNPLSFLNRIHSRDRKQASFHDIQ